MSNYTATVSNTALSALLTIPPAIRCLTTPTSVNLTWPSASGVTTYNVQYKISTAAAYTVYERTNDEMTTTVTNLTPATVYSFQILNSATGAILYSGTATTSSPSLANYTKAALGTTTNGAYNLGLIVPYSGVTKEQIVASLFSTGDVVYTTASTSIKSTKTLATVVQNTASLNMKGLSSVYIPFSSAVVTSQTVNLIDSSNSTIAVVYGTTQITVGGVARSIGERFMIDGRYATVASS